MFCFFKNIGSDRLVYDILYRIQAPSIENINA